MEIQFLTVEKLVHTIRAAGIPCADETPRQWVKRHPGLAMRVGHRLVFPSRFLDLYLSGMRFEQIAEQLQAGAKATTNSTPDVTPAPDRRTGNRKRGWWQE